MSLERLAKVLGIDIRWNDHYNHLVEYYKQKNFGTNISMVKALEDMIFDRIETLVDTIEELKGE